MTNIFWLSLEKYIVIKPATMKSTVGYIYMCLILCAIDVKAVYQIAKDIRLFLSPVE